MALQSLHGTWTEIESLFHVGRIPLDPRLTQSLEEGKSFVEAFAGTPAQKAMEDVLQKLLQGSSSSSDSPPRTEDSEQNKT